MNVIENLRSVENRINGYSERVEAAFETSEGMTLSHSEVCRMAGSLEGARQEISEAIRQLVGDERTPVAGGHASRGERTTLLPSADTK